MIGVYRLSTFGLLLLTSQLAAGCGDPLVDGTYRGEPLFVITGRVTEGMVTDPQEIPEPDQPARVEDVRVVLFWTKNPDQPTGTLEAFSAVEQKVEIGPSMILRYEIRIYTPPPDAVLRRSYGGEGQVALGVIIAYVDTNRSGSWEPDADRLNGGVPGYLVVYTPQGASGPMFEEPLQPGFHVLTAKPCGPNDHLMQLVQNDNSELELMVNLNVQTSLYLDLDCDGDVNEWLWPRCPPPEEVEMLCGPEPSPEHTDMCGFCVGFEPFEECAHLIEQECHETPPELCEPYQICLNPEWVPDLFFVCEFLAGRCSEQSDTPMCEELHQTCLGRLEEECASQHEECTNAPEPDPGACNDILRDCIRGITQQPPCDITGFCP